MADVTPPADWSYIIRMENESGDWAIALFKEAEFAQRFLLGLRER